MNKFGQFHLLSILAAALTHCRVLRCARQFKDGGGKLPGNHRQHPLLIHQVADVCIYATFFLLLKHMFFFFTALVCFLVTQYCAGALRMWLVANALNIATSEPGAVV